MPSPLPGMDPYLEQEKLWPAFQRQFVLSLYQHLLPVLVDRYRARVVQRHYVRQQALFTSVFREEHYEEYIEIRQRADNKWITLLEVVNPANKSTSEGRAAYLQTRTEARQAQANLVEIDLLLQGQPMLDYSRDSLPDWDYAVSVTRASQPERYEVYTATLKKRLPRFRLPLASDDRDSVLDLQTVFTRCYDQGNFAQQIDYTQNPTVPLTDDDLRWLVELLKQQRLRPA
ncbi:MAG: DUF4058 family protein [Gemmataceae bacterium]